MLHKYLVKAENHEKAIFKVRRKLQQEDAGWPNGVLPCVSAAECCVKEVIREIDIVVAHYEDEIKSCLKKASRSIGEEALTLQELVDLSRKDLMSAWHMMKLFQSAAPL
jgi:hypothetical protein